MSSGNIDIQVTSDERDIIKGQDKIIKSLEKTSEKYRKMLMTVKKGGKQGRTELERFAAATNKINRTPAQKYKETVDKLNQALRKGLITQQTYNRAVARAGKEHGKTFGGAGIAKIAGWTSAIGLAIAALAKVLLALQEIREESDALGGRQKTAAAGLGSLVQLSRGDPREQKRLRQLAQKTFLEGGAEDLGGAAELIFSLGSVGQLDSRKLFSDLKAADVIQEPAQLAADVQTLIKSAGLAETKGTARRLVNKAFVGAQFGGFNTPGGILKAVARQGGSTKALGLNENEVFAAVSLASESIGQAAEGGTVVDAFLTSLRKQGGFENKSIAQSVKEIADLNLGGEELFEFFGRKEAVRFFEIARDQQKTLQRNQQAIGNAARSNLSQRAIDINRADPLLSAVQQRRRGKAREEIANQQRGLKANIAQGLIDEEAARGKEQGQSDLRIFFGKFRRDLQRQFFGDDAIIGTLGKGQNPAQGDRALDRTAKAMEAAAENLRDATEQFGNRERFVNGQRQDQRLHGGGVEAN